MLALLNAPGYAPVAQQVAQHQQRGCSTAAKLAGEAGVSDSDLDSVRLRIVRWLAACMLGAAAWQVLPGLGPNAVVQTVTLLDAQEPFLQRSAVSRVRLLASSDSTALPVIRAGAAPKLVQLLRPDLDESVVPGMLAAMRELCRIDEGRQALRAAGAERVLAAAKMQSWYGEAAEEAIQNVLALL
ncbi:hypothetical protein WJX72_009949 [[Myrmecia] bisecta]|uniref:Uncharacterized protein n=1 Tax=[Myrmecia] bisecta TaxID=41462 RepID=A0AAW1R995_9CHLO